MLTFVFDFQISLGMYVKVISYLYSFSNVFYFLIMSTILLKGDEHWTVPAFSRKSVLYRFNSVYMFTFIFDFQISLGIKNYMFGNMYSACSPVWFNP